MSKEMLLFNFQLDIHGIQDKKKKYTTFDCRTCFLLRLYFESWQEKTITAV